MTAESRVSLTWPTLAGAALALVALGAGAGYLGMGHRGGTRDPAMNGSANAPRSDAPGSSPSPSAGSALPDVEVTLGNESVERAGIALSPVVSRALGRELRAPGVVEPNIYRQVVVRPVVGGRVTRVLGELGQAVRQGDVVAQVFSPELAEAETRYIALRAELGAHEAELARTEKLVGIGAASRQELERIHAEHTARLADLESARSRLRLLGLSPGAIEALAPAAALEAMVDILAPIAGVITERNANPGLNVDATTSLLTVTDLSTVWVVVDVFERDFSLVKVGMRARITLRAYPDRVLQGRVGYIDPQVNLATRTAKVRIEVPNGGRDLRLGMYAEALFDRPDAPSTSVVPRAAVQYLGDRTVVYIADSTRPGTFIEREVHVEAPIGDDVPVVSGVQAGEIIVTEGGFAVRAERERLGLRSSARVSP
jgi:cobalt-zinc-cadmium efflux system membrane fusion protein